MKNCFVHKDFLHHPHFIIAVLLHKSQTGAQSFKQKSTGLSNVGDFSGK